LTILAEIRSGSWCLSSNKVRFLRADSLAGTAPAAHFDRHTWRAHLTTTKGIGVAPDRQRTRGEFPYFGEPYTHDEQQGVSPAAQTTTK
jgi:hypothetical protein